jgi:hypothetical protein
MLIRHREKCNTIEIIKFFATIDVNYDEKVLWNSV